MKIQCTNPGAVVKRAYYLAYEACGGPSGMGVFQAREDVTENEVWTNITGSQFGGDYPTGERKISSNVDNTKPGKVYGDYVFGRMMKLGLEWDEESVTVRDTSPRSDYQSWCRKYPTYEALVRAAIKSLQG